MKKQLMLVAGLALAGLSAPAFADGNGFVRVEAGSSDVDISVEDLGSAATKTPPGVSAGATGSIRISQWKASIASSSARL